MKKHFLSFILLAVLCFSASAQTKIYADSAVMTFKNDTFNFGNVAPNQILEHDFIFSNTGKIPLVITEGYTDCPCDVCSYPTEPIKPNGKQHSIIHYKIDLANRRGYFNKIISIHSNNFSGDVILHVRGNIVQVDSLMLFTRTIINGDTFPATDEWKRPLASNSFETNCALFDTVRANGQVHIRYQFVNQAKSPMVIVDAKGSAGSVVPSHDKNPIPPGKTGEIDVIFFTDGSRGPQSKTVTVDYYTGDQNNHQVMVVLRLEGYVLQE